MTTKESSLQRSIAFCLGCGSVIESSHRHDFVGCDCSEDDDTGFALDGGTAYFRLVGNFASMLYLGIYDDDYTIDQFSTRIKEAEQYLADLHKARNMLKKGKVTNFVDDFDVEKEIDDRIEFLEQELN